MIHGTRTKTLIGSALLALGLNLLGGCTTSAPDFEPIIRAENLRQIDAPALATAAGAREARLRARAAVAYGRIAQEAGIAPLFRLLGDDDLQVRSAAAF